MTNYFQILSSDVWNVRHKFDEARNRAYDDYKKATTNEEREKILNYIGNTFEIEKNTEDDMTKINELSQKINETLAELNSKIIRY